MQTIARCAGIDMSAASRTRTQRPIVTRVVAAALAVVAGAGCGADRTPADSLGQTDRAIGQIDRGEMNLRVVLDRSSCLAGEPVVIRVELANVAELRQAPGVRGGARAELRCFAEGPSFPASYALCSQGVDLASAAPGSSPEASVDVLRANRRGSIVFSPRARFSIPGVHTVTVELVVNGEPTLSAATEVSVERSTVRMCRMVPRNASGARGAVLGYCLLDPVGTDAESVDGRARLAGATFRRQRQQMTIELERLFDVWDNNGEVLDIVPAEASYSGVGLPTLRPVIRLDDALVAVLEPGESQRFELDAPAQLVSPALMDVAGRTDVWALSEDGLRLSLVRFGPAAGMSSAGAAVALRPWGLAERAPDDASGGTREDASAPPAPPRVSVLIPAPQPLAPARVIWSAGTERAPILSRAAISEGAGDEKRALLLAFGADASFELRLWLISLRDESVEAAEQAQQLEGYTLLAGAEALLQVDRTGAARAQLLVTRQGDRDGSVPVWLAAASWSGSADDPLSVELRDLGELPALPVHASSYPLPGAIPGPENRWIAVLGERGLIGGTPLRPIQTLPGRPILPLHVESYEGNDFILIESEDGLPTFHPVAR